MTDKKELKKDVVEKIMMFQKPKILQDLVVKKLLISKCVSSLKMFQIITNFHESVSGMLYKKSAIFFHVSICKWFHQSCGSFSHYRESQFEFPVRGKKPAHLIRNTSVQDEIAPFKF